MITLGCPCGARFQVRREQAGQRTKCPSCGATLVIPSLRPASGQAPRGRAAALMPIAPSLQVGRLAGIVIGSLMLLTVIIPWAHGGRGMFSSPEVIMSWELIGEPGDAAEMLSVFIIGGWVIALAAVICSAAVTRMARGWVQLSLGLLFLVLIAFTVLGIMGPPPGVSGTGTLAVVVIALLSIVLMIAGMHLRFRFPDRLAAKLLPGIAGGVVAVCELASVVGVARSIRDAKGWGIVMAILLTAIGLMVLAAGALSALNAVLSRQWALRIAKTVLNMAYTAVACLPLYLLLSSIATGEEAVLLLVYLNVMLLICGGVFLLGCGILTLGTAFMDKTGRTAAPAAAAGISSPAQDASAEEPVDLQYNDPGEGGFTSMAIRCRCGKEIRITLAQAGKIGRCPNPECGRQIQIPPENVLRRFDGKTVAYDQLPT